MFEEEITLNILRNILYNNSNPIFRYSEKSCKTYDFICKFIPQELREYHTEEYDCRKIWGIKRSNSSFSKLINKDFIPLKFKNTIFKLLSEDFQLLLDIENKFKTEWSHLKGDKLLLKNTLTNMKTFNIENYGDKLVNCVENNNYKPEKVLTILFLYAIIDKKIFLLYDNSFDDISSLNTTYVSSENIESGEYMLIYGSGAMFNKKSLIYSKLIISDDKVYLYNNYNQLTDSSEYSYEGHLKKTSTGLIIILKNVDSDEFVTISFLKSVGKFRRYLGLMLGLTSSRNPVCVKVACFLMNEYKNVNNKVLTDILYCKNISWYENILAFENEDIMKFFSENIYKKNK